MKSLNVYRKTTILRILLITFFIGIIVCKKAYAEEINNGIPVIYINIDETKGTIAKMNGSEDHSVRCYGSVDIKVPAGYKSLYSEKVLETMEGLKLDYIRGRGNNTWKNDKKPYTFKLEQKADILGMGEGKSWILLANANDMSKVKNMLTFMLADSAGMEFTPKAVPVDVVMNGKYLGSYQLATPVKVGSSRVDIDELEQKDSDPETITGGYLLSMGGQKQELPESLIEVNGHLFVAESPEFENGKYENEAQKKYISDYLQKTDDAIRAAANSDFSDRSYKDYIDVNSFADLWWMQEFAQNPDAFMSGSTYYYKKRNGKLYLGPVWDFDMAWGTDRKADDIGTVFYDEWLSLLFCDSEFCDTTKKRWTAFSKSLDDIVKDGGKLDVYANEIKKSWLADYKLWEPENSDPEAIFNKEIKKLKSWISERKNYIDNHLDDIDGLGNIVSFYDDDTLVEKRFYSKGDGVNVTPDVEPREGKFFLGWFDENDKKCEPGVIITKDTVFHSKFIDEDKAVKGDVLYFKQNEVWYDSSKWLPRISYTLLPENSMDTGIIWKSSDESVITVDEDAMPQIVGPGKAVITATVGSGKEYSMTVNIYEATSETEDVKAEEIVVDNMQFELEVGEYAHINTSVKPYYASNIISFKSEDEKIAIVDDNGVIKALSAGETKIVVSESGSEKSVECVVKVKKKPGEPEPDDKKSSDESSGDTSESVEESIESTESAEPTESAESIESTESKADKDSSKGNIVIIIVGAALLAALGFGWIIVRKNKKK